MHNITPTRVNKGVLEKLFGVDDSSNQTEIGELTVDQIEKKLSILRSEMLRFAAELEFEAAAEVRDQIKKLEMMLLV